MEVNDSIAGYCSSSSLVISSDEMHLNPSLGLAVMLFCLASFQGPVLPSPSQASSASATLNKIDLLNSYSSVVEEDYFSSSTLDDAPGDGSREEPYGNYQQGSIVVTSATYVALDVVCVSRGSAGSSVPLKIGPSSMRALFCT